jgi:type VI secretion system protein VasG
MAATDAVHGAGGEVSSSLLMEAVRPVLVEHFQSALLARFQTIVYRPLSTSALETIVRMKLDKVAQRMAWRFGVTLQCDDALVAELARACQLPDTGARNIDSLLDQQILPVLSRELLLRVGQQKLPRHVQLDYSENEGISVEFNDAVDAVA